MKVENVKISELIPAEYNPRKLSAKQKKDIEASLKEFGIVDPIIVNSNPDRKNIIIGGHQRVKVWKEMGNQTVPVYYIDLTIEKEKELNVRLNKNTGEFDFDILNNLFEKEELINWGFDKVDLLLDYKPITENDINKMACELENRFNKDNKLKEVICPNCKEKFYV